MEIVVEKDGNAHCVYAEAIPIQTLGSLHIARASHVEPVSNGKWGADLGPVSGPKLGPFGNRTEALNAETDWLRFNWLGKMPEHRCMPESSRP